MEIFKVCLLKQVVKYFIWNSWFLQNAESLLLDYYAIQLPKSHRSNRAFGNVSEAVILLFFVFFCFLGIWLLSAVNGNGCDLEH